MFKKGQIVRIKETIRYQYLKDGAMIEPMIEHHISGGETAEVYAVLQEDNDRIIIETSAGLFDPEELENTELNENTIITIDAEGLEIMAVYDELECEWVVGDGYNSKRVKTRDQVIQELKDICDFHDIELPEL